MGQCRSRKTQRVLLSLAAVSAVGVSMIFAATAAASDTAYAVKAWSSGAALEMSRPSDR